MLTLPPDIFHCCPNCRSTKISLIDGVRFSCASCQFSYFHNTASAVAAMILVEDEILLTTRAKKPGKGLLDLPGGFVDQFESLEQALTREIREELSIEMKDWQYFISFPNQYMYKGVNYHTCDSIFITTLPDKPELSIQQSEIALAAFYPLAELPLADIAFDSIRSAITELIRLRMNKNL